MGQESAEARDHDGSELPPGQPGAVVDAKNALIGEVVPTKETARAPHRAISHGHWKLPSTARTLENPAT